MCVNTSKYMKIYNNKRELIMIHAKYVWWCTRDVYGSAQELFMVVHEKYLSYCMRNIYGSAQEIFVVVHEKYLW